MARKNRHPVDPIAHAQEAQEIRDRKDGGGRWPAEPFKRIGAWLKHAHEPQTEEILQLAHDLYRPLPQILLEIEVMTKQLDALTASVAQSNTVAKSAITLLEGLKTKLDEAIAAEDDGEALQSLSDSLGAETTELAAAVTANTPADPAPPADATPPADGGGNATGA